MIIDTDSSTAPPPAQRYDVCIAGGGVAGIVLAHKLAQHGKRILILEAGDIDYSDESQSLYEGSNIGREYFDLDTARLRYLGGTSNHWGGWCRPLDRYDFEKRDYIENSGWPIGLQDVDPYHAAAKEIVEISDFPSDIPLAGSNGGLKEIFFNFSPPVRFGDKYKDFLASSKEVDVFLNANLIDIELDTDNGSVSAFTFRGYSDDSPVRKSAADKYVLALGGIENARALLNANRQIPQGIGNETDLVGRYFMEHIHNTLGYYVMDSSKTRFGDTGRFVSLTSKAMQQTGLTNAGFRLNSLESIQDEGVTVNAQETFNRFKLLVQDALCANEVIADYFRTLKTLKCGPRRIWSTDKSSHPDRSGLLRVASEQIPNRNSRVTITAKKDRFGLRTAVLDWRLLPQDKISVRTGALKIATYMASQDIGRVKLLPWVLDENNHDFPGVTDGEEVGGFHHMGTARMGLSKQDSVVDRHCRVHGIKNLYVAGSSVFTTGGHANPTFTIVQLALRLADHLART
ncbi:MAG: GMC family oxidoreductase [Rhodospirillales bacterium]|nr:GMC family oxidoreductase [Rhodospirillales bacterium]